MLENLYTTKMSANKKALQSRFSKIRSKSGRLSKMMALVMSVTIAVTMLCATVVMAAVGNDGLEYRSKNEIYFLAGLKTNISAPLDNMPQWLKDISSNGKIGVFLSRTDTKGIHGNVVHGFMLNIAGDKNEADFVMGSASFNHYSPVNSMKFYRKDKLQDEARVLLILNSDEEYNTSLLSIFFTTKDSDEDKYFHSSRFKESFISVDESQFEFVGDFEKIQKEFKCQISTEDNFTYYEKSYNNRKADGIDINISQINQDAIILDIKTASAEFDYVKISVKKQEDILTDQGYFLAELKEYNNFVLKPDMFYMEDFESGGKYTVDVIALKTVSDDQRTVVFRQRNSITIPL